jgi:hypothetical protein
MIKEKIEFKQGLFDRKYNCKVVNIDSSFLEYICENGEKLKQFIYLD